MAKEEHSIHVLAVKATAAKRLGGECGPEPIPKAN